MSSEAKRKALPPEKPLNPGNTAAPSRSALFFKALDETGTLQERQIHADSQSCKLWLRALSGASAIHLPLRVGESLLRTEIEVESDEPIAVQVVWDDKTVLDVASDSRRVFILPSDARYEPPQALEPKPTSKSLDLLFLVDGTTRVMFPKKASDDPDSSEETLAFELLINNKDHSQAWTGLVRKLTEFADAMAQQYTETQTRVFAFGDHSMDFIASSPDLRGRYLFYPADAAERSLAAYTPEDLQQQFSQLPSTFGGDFVDALAEALEQCRAVGWRSKARKILVLCGDSPGFSVLQPPPPGADIHVRRVDVDQEALRLHELGVEIVAIYLGTPVSLADSPYHISDPKMYLDYTWRQYRRLASLPGFLWTGLSFDPKKAARTLEQRPKVIARGTHWGIMCEDPASENATSQGRARAQPSV